MPNSLLNPPNIYLVGLMGAGKTTVGRALARRIGYRFVDSDQEIEARTGVSIPTIFEIEGEAGFRRREALVIAELTRDHGQVIATGGGAVLLPENRERLRSGGFVAYLRVPPRVLHERTRQDRNRPLLRVADPLARLEALHAERDPFYREVADIIVDGGRGNAQSITQLLAREAAARCKL